MIDYEKVLMCLEQSGITIDNEGEMIDVESINFISAVISLEEEFSIEFPDELLSYDKIKNIDYLCEVIERVKKGL